MWFEVDLEAREWGIRAERMKGQTEHLVPLSDAAVDLPGACPAVARPGGLAVPLPRAPRQVAQEHVVDEAAPRAGHRRRATRLPVVIP